MGLGVLIGEVCLRLAVCFIVCSEGAVKIEEIAMNITTEASEVPCMFLQ